MADKYYDYTSLDEQGLGSFYRFDSPSYEVRVSFDTYTYSDIIYRYELLKNATSFGIISRKIEDTQEIGIDETLGNTISKIVLERFSIEKNPEQDAIIIYHCDWLDGKQCARYRKFNTWYSKGGFDGYLTHISQKIEIEGISHYLGLLFHTNNPNSERIKEEFNQVIEFIATYEYAKTRGHEQEEAVTDGETDGGL